MDRQGSDIQALLNEVNSAGNALLHPAERLADEGPARRRLVAAAQKLVYAAQNPLEAVLEVSFQNHRTAVIRACDDLGVFQLVPQTGSVSLQELVGKTGADRQLLYRFMRMLIATGIFAEVERDVYAHNGLSLACGGPAKYVMNHIYAECSNASYKLPKYLRRTSYGTKPDPDGFIDPMRYALGTKESLFSWLLTQPDRLTNFNLAMKAGSLKATISLRNYPFGAELASVDSENEILLVDVGGGRGHVVEAIRAKHPGLKGRMIVQDLRETIEEIEDPKGFEPMAHDFFEPQPIKGKYTQPGAHIYYFSRILHDWSDADCNRILQQTVSAMDPARSRVLISDWVLPDTGVSSFEALLDINMMMIGGMERSKGQWTSLLDAAGLEIVNIWEEGELMEARLKG